MPLTFTPATQSQVDFMQNILLTYVNKGTHAPSEQTLAQATITALQGAWPLTLTHQQDEFLQTVMLDYQTGNPNLDDMTNQLLQSCQALIAG